MTHLLKRIELKSLTILTADKRCGVTGTLMH